MVSPTSSVRSYAAPSRAEVDELRGLVSGAVIVPGDADYKAAIHRWSAGTIRPAGIVVKCAGVPDVQACVRWAVKHNVEVAVKGGGLSPVGASSTENGIVVDLERLNEVAIDKDARTITCGGGTIWEKVYAALDEAKLTCAGGGYWGVGVSGYTLGAGYSWFSGLYGLGCDNLLAAKMVLADGSAVACSANEEPELFFSIKGTSSNFGIVTELVTRAYPYVGPVMVGALIYRADQLDELIGVLLEYLRVRDGTSSCVLAFVNAPPHFQPILIIQPWIIAKTVEDAHNHPHFGAFWSKIKPVHDATHIAETLVDFSHAADDFLNAGPPQAVNSVALFESMSAEMIKSAYDNWRAFTQTSDEVRTSNIFFELHHQPVIANVPLDAAAFHCRTHHYYVVALGKADTLGTLQAKCKPWCKSFVDVVRQDQIKRHGRDLLLSGNSCQGDEALEEVYGPNYPRLRRNKARYDPNKVFHRYFCIEPDFGDANGMH